MIEKLIIDSKVLKNVKFNVYARCERNARLFLMYMRTHEDI